MRQIRAFTLSAANYAQSTVAATVQPFMIPPVNFKRNSDRYVSANAVLRVYLREILELQFPGITNALVPLMAFTDRLDSENQVKMCQQLKALHTWFISWALTRAPDAGKFPLFAWNSRESVPSVLVEFFRWFRNGDKDFMAIIPVIRFIITWLTLYKVYTIPTAPSLEPVTSPTTGVDVELKGYAFGNALKDMGITVERAKEIFKKKISEHQFHESSAAGPNGHALWSAHIDAVALTRSEKTGGAVIALANKLKLTEIPRLISAGDDVFNDTVVKDSPGIARRRVLHSKLHCIFDKGIKNRLIAIGDYYSQAVLTPFLGLYRELLALLPNDYTYNQDAGFEAIKAFSAKGYTLYSLDLSKATDRLPATSQRDVLAILLDDKETAEMWYQVMVNREFITENGHKVRYNTGQPQGLKSSFHSMAFFHHVIVHLASHHVGYVGWDGYAIVGDDIVMTDLKVVEAYKAIMLLLGVEISASKSVYHNSETGISGAEFCSRLVVDGVEITGLSTHLLANTLDNPEYAISLWEDIMRKSIISHGDILTFFAIFLKDLDLERLVLMNALPQSITGMHFPLVPSDWDAYNPAKWLANYGYSLKDLEAFYYFSVVSDQLAKVDGLIRKASSWLSIALESSKLIDLDEYEAQSVLPLTVAIREKLSASDATHTVSHPVQFAARTLGRKIVNILNAFSSDNTSFGRLMMDKKLTSLQVSLDSKPDYLPTEITAYGSRKMLEKALRLCKESAMDGGQQDRTFVGRITGVSAAWSVAVGLKKGLIIAPHASAARNVSPVPSTRLMNIRSKGKSSLL